MIKEAIPKLITLEGEEYIEHTRLNNDVRFVVTVHCETSKREVDAAFRRAYERHKGEDDG